GTIKVIRSTIFALHAHEMGDEDAPGIRARVLEECEQAARSLGFPPAVRFTGPVDLLIGDEVAEHLLPVLRETLSNAARHANAARVDVDLAAADSKITLTVSDDGAGIAPGGRRSGLTNLSERAEQLGGTFSVGRGATGGTVAVWSVPVSGVGSPDGSIVAPDRV
ncbi:MAG TPA: ATP-binding protein, partial [Thermoleophilia bacterium]|nr:ATP-binding protein [Thermoleophilia bacterium]